MSIMMNLNQFSQAGNILSSIGSLGALQTNFTTRRDIVTVNGLQEAREFKLDKGERIAMIDSNSDILYIKECDDIGKYSLKVFECKEITDKYEKENTPAVISRAEMDSMISSMNEIKAMLGGMNGKFNAQKQGN